MDEVEAAVRRVIDGLAGFAADMRRQGIHVGAGRDPHCVTCGDRWPCEASKRQENDR